MPARRTARTSFIVQVHNFIAIGWYHLAGLQLIGPHRQDSTQTSCAAPEKQWVLHRTPCCGRSDQTPIGGEHARCTVSRGLMNRSVSRKRSPSAWRGGERSNDRGTPSLWPHSVVRRCWPVQGFTLPCLRPAKQNARSGHWAPSVHAEPGVSLFATSRLGT